MSVAAQEILMDDCPKNYRPFPSQPTYVTCCHAGIDGPCSDKVAHLVFLLLSFTCTVKFVNSSYSNSPCAFLFPERGQG